MLQIKLVSNSYKCMRKQGNVGYILVSELLCNALCSVIFLGVLRGACPVNNKILLKKNECLFPVVCRIITWYVICTSDMIVIQGKVLLYELNQITKTSIYVFRP